MPKPRWTTTAQRSWLEEHIPAFNEAQENGLTTKVFYPELYANWDRAFNPEPPSATELLEAGGVLGIDEAIKKKFMEIVSFIIQVRNKAPTDTTTQTFRGSLNGFIIQRVHRHHPAKKG